MLQQVFCSIRSERQLIEQMQYNLLYHWFIGLSMDDEVWVLTVFSKNREWLIEHDAVIALCNEVVDIASGRSWLSGEHFNVDGTLIQAWAGHKSFKRKASDDNEDGGDFVVSRTAATRTSPRATRMRGCNARGQDGQRTALHGAYPER